MIDFILIRQVVSNCALDLLESDRRKRFLNALGGGSVSKGVDDRIQRHSCVADTIDTFSFSYVFTSHANALT